MHKYKNSYACPKCGDTRWHVQNRNGPVEAKTDPQITHVECAVCGYTESLEPTYEPEDKENHE